VRSQVLIVTKTIIYLVRHGQTLWNIIKRTQGMRRVPLNRIGKRQAILLAKKLKDLPFNVIYASPALRTMQTARIIAPGKKIIPHPDIRELDRPAFEGLTHKQIRKRIPDIEQQWAQKGIDWRPPAGGESLREYQKRSIRAFKQLVRKHQGKQILVVTHGGPIKSIVHWLHGGNPKDFLHRRNPENAEVVRIVIHNGKSTIVRSVLK